MERTTTLKDAKKVLGHNFIGPEELIKIKEKMPIADPKRYGPIPTIPYSLKSLKKLQKDHLLVLGIPKITLCSLRNFFGVAPDVSQPCFYNQDWYLKEKFANETTLDYKWYLISKKVVRQTRGKSPDVIKKKMGKNEKFPSAILTAYVFFANFLLSGGEILWKNDFLWCADKDSNGDQIYTGRYIDPKRINKNGFNVHRHLSIRPCYGYVRILSDD